MIKVRMAVLIVLKEIYALHKIIQASPIRRRRRRKRKREGQIYISKIMKRSGYSYMHVYDTVRRLEKMGLIKIHKEDGHSYIELTDRGLKLAETSYTLFKELEEILKEGGEQDVMGGEV